MLSITINTEPDLSEKVLREDQQDSQINEAMMIEMLMQLVCYL